MPDSARVWVFAAAQPVVGADAETLLVSVETFIRGWVAHGTPVVGGFDWRYDRFLVVAADEEATGVSGCSIDSLFRTLKGCEGALGVSLLDSSLVFYRDQAGAVQAAPRAEFRELVAAEDVMEDTVVFDNTVGILGGLRHGEWERPLSESWHARAFPVKQAR
jgi:hypothetical protein